VEDNAVLDVALIADDDGVGLKHISTTFSDIGHSPEKRLPLTMVCKWTYPLLSIAIDNFAGSMLLFWISGVFIEYECKLTPVFLRYV
jgi:hypothetical protein